MQIIGNRLNASVGTFDQEQIEAYRGIGVAQVSDCMGRLYGAVNISAQYSLAARLAGRAMTVKTRPGDNLLVHKAIMTAQPGDVIVVDAGGDLNNAIFGELMMTDAARRGVGGLVIDGAIRDADVLRKADFPVFARGISHRGPYKSGPGELNVPVCIGGMAVLPGDLILGDADGVVAIPSELAGKLLDEARAKVAAEDASMIKIAEGRHNKPWVDATLRELGAAV